MISSWKPVFALLLLASGPALTQGHKPVSVASELPGWKCMLPAAVFGPQGDNAPAIPEYENSALGAPQIGIGAGVLIIPVEARPTNGRVPVLRPNGTRAWIQIDLLVPWRSLNNPKAACRPVVLSNGRYGTTTSG